MIIRSSPPSDEVSSKKEQSFSFQTESFLLFMLFRKMTPLVHKSGGNGKLTTVLERVSWTSDGSGSLNQLVLDCLIKCYSGKKMASLVLSSVSSSPPIPWSTSKKIIQLTFLTLFVLEASEPSDSAMFSYSNQGDDRFATSCDFKPMSPVDIKASSDVQRKEMASMVLSSASSSPHIPWSASEKIVPAQNLETFFTWRIPVPMVEALLRITQRHCCGPCVLRLAESPSSTHCTVRRASYSIQICVTISPNQAWQPRGSLSCGQLASLRSQSSTASAVHCIPE